MKAWSPVTFGLAAGAVGVLAGAGLVAYHKLRRENDPAELERQRRAALCRTGRITSGEVTGLIEPEGESQALLLIYRYEIAGVSYEVAQDVSMMPQVAVRAARLVGQTVSIKYEMKHPSNSIVACEGWSGISGLDLRKPEAAGTPPSNNPLPLGEGEPRSGG